MEVGLRLSEDTSASAIKGKVRVPKTAELLAARIRAAIGRGELRAGDKLPPEGQLLQDVEVSRPTGREAMRILESEGLITIERGVNGGARVRPFSTGLLTRSAGLLLQMKGITMADVYQARSSVEVMAVQMLTKHPDAAAFDLLQAHYEHELTLLEHNTTRVRAVARFHQLLLENCGNATLGVIGSMLHDIGEKHLEASFRLRENGDPLESERSYLRGFKSHGKLIGLMRSGDVAKAESFWQLHMEVSGRVWLTGLEGATVIDIVERA